MAVRGVGEFQAEHLGVGLRLLQAISGSLVARFRLDHGEREIARVAEEKIDAFRRLANEAFADRHDATVRD